MNSHMWHLFRKWVEQSIWARSERTNLNRAGGTFYARHQRADERYMTYIRVIADLVDTTFENAESVLDRLYAVVSDIRYEDGMDAAIYRRDRILVETAAFAANDRDLLWSLDLALDAFGCPDAREREEAAYEAEYQEWLKQVEAREAAEAAQ